MEQSTNTKDVNEIVSEIHSHVSCMSVNELASLRNKLITTEVAIVNASRVIDIYMMSDILAWAEVVDISFTSKDSPSFPVTYWMDDTPSSISFDSERDALISAFEAWFQSDLGVQFSHLVRYLVSGAHWEITVSSTGETQGIDALPLDILVSRIGHSNNHDVDIFLTNIFADAETYHSLKVSHDNELTWDHISSFFHDADFDDIDNLLRCVFDGISFYCDDLPLYHIFFNAWKAERQKL